MMKEILLDLIDIVHSYKYSSEKHMFKDLIVLWPWLHQMSKW